MIRIKTIQFNIIADERGQLISIESNKNIPFNIKRVYYLFGTQAGVGRGFHAHKELEQVLVCTSGSCTILLDDGEKKQTFKLDRPDQGLYISSLLWREMHDFSPDCVLTVFASEHYNESDYIRDYDEFLAEIR